jgi:hypothetical protein
LPFLISFLFLLTPLHLESTLLLEFFLPSLEFLHLCFLSLTEKDSLLLLPFEFNSAQSFFFHPTHVFFFKAAATVIFHASHAIFFNEAFLALLLFLNLFLVLLLDKTLVLGLHLLLMDYAFSFDFGSLS